MPKGEEERHEEEELLHCLQIAWSCVRAALVQFKNRFSAPIHAFPLLLHKIHSVVPMLASGSVGRLVRVGSTGQACGCSAQLA